jgi:hypothetical protein
MVAQSMVIAKRDKDKLKSHYHAKICGDNSKGRNGSTCNRYLVTKRKGMLKSAMRHVLVMLQRPWRGS